MKTSSRSPTSRRQLIQLGGAACVLPFFEALSRRGALGALQGRSAVSEAFDTFTEVWSELHDEHLDEYIMEEAYVYRLAAEAQGLMPSDVPPMQRKVFETERLTSGPSWGSGRIFALIVEIAPNAVLYPHDHPGHVVVTMGLEGAAHYRHYEIADEAPPRTDHGTPFLVRETRRGLLLPGRTTHLSRSRDNLHTFTAGPKGALMVDFTTEIGGPDFGMLGIDEKAEDAFHGLYGARWKEVAF